MNSSRPRTLLLNQTFQCISSLEEFSRIDNATLSDSSLNQSQYHLHHPLHSKPNENNVQTPSKTSCLVDNAPKPKQIIEHHNNGMEPLIEKKLQIQGYSYVRLRHDRILPRDDAYELSEEDIEFLRLFNQDKIGKSSSKGETSEDLLKQFFIHFEKKSTRQTTATKEESLIDMSDELKESLEAADLDVLYQYWKRERENDKYLRQGELFPQKEIYPFMRKYWRANSEEQAYHATFRPREYCRKKTRKSTRTDNKEIQEKLLGLETDLNKCRMIALKLKKRELIKRELAYQAIDDYSKSVPGLSKEFKIFNTFYSRAAEIDTIQGQISPKVHKNNKKKQNKVKKVSLDQPNSENIITLPIISNNEPKEVIQPKEEIPSNEVIKIGKNRTTKQNKIVDDNDKTSIVEETKGLTEIPNVETKKEKQKKSRKQTDVVNQQNETSALIKNQDPLTGGIDIKQESAQLEADGSLKNGVVSNETGNKRRQKKSGQNIIKEKKEEGISEINLQKKEQGQVQEIKENIVVDQINRDVMKIQDKQQLFQPKQQQAVEREKLKLDTQDEQTSFLSNFLMYFSSLGIPVTVDNVQDSDIMEAKSQAIQEEKSQKLKNPNTFAYLIRQRVGRAGRVFLDRVCDNPTDVGGIQSGKISYFIEPTKKQIIYNTFSYPNPEAIRMINQQQPPVQQQQQQTQLSFQQQQQSPLATPTTATSTTTNTMQINNLKMAEEDFLLTGSSAHNEVKNDFKEKEFSGGVTVSDRTKEKERDLYKSCIAFEAKNQRIQELIQKHQKSVLPDFFRNQKGKLSSKNRNNKNNSYLAKFIDNEDDSDTSFQSGQQGNNPFQNLRQKVQLRVKEREKLKQQQIQKEKAELQRQIKLQQQKELESKQQQQLQQQKSSLFPENQIKFHSQQSHQNGDIQSSLQNPFTLQQQRLDSVEVLLNENTQMISEQLGENQFTQSDLFYQNNQNQYNPFNNIVNSSFKPETPLLQSFNSQNLQQFGVNQLIPQDSNIFHNFDNLPNQNAVNSIMQSPSHHSYFSPNHNPNQYDNFANQQRDINNPYEQLSINIPIQDNLQNANHGNHNYGYFSDLNLNNPNIIESNNIPYDQTQFQTNNTLNNNNNNEQLDVNDGFEQDYLNCNEEQPDQFLDDIENPVNFNQNNDC